LECDVAHSHLLIREGRRYIVSRRFEWQCRCQHYFRGEVPDPGQSVAINATHVRAVATAEGWILASEGYKRPVPRRKSNVKRAESAARAGTALALFRAMPEISRFFGIAITMFYSEHGLPHFHARYGAHEVSVEIESGLVRGEFPARALGLVLEWRTIHRAELLEAWQAAREHRPLRPIAPLE
ncbi:MAG: DUF4160 domain-containing protein, partial [Acidobacteriota bacterium]